MSDVGFAALPAQVHRKSVKKGFEFCLMLMGESGLGKTTFVNALFQRDFAGGRTVKPTSERVESGSEIRVVHEDIVEKQVKLRLTFVDTQDFADSVDNSDSFLPAYDYIVKMFDTYLEQESRVKRSTIADERVHALCYFISPSSHGLRPLDISALQKVHKLVNVVPVIAKADTLTKEETAKLKAQIMSDITKHNIKIYQLPADSDDEEDMENARAIQASMPFAIVSSRKKVMSNGKEVFGRDYPWGVVEMENDEHCDFNLTRDLLVRQGMHDLKDNTHDLYEEYRCLKLGEEDDGHEE